MFDIHNKFNIDMYITLNIMTIINKKQFNHRFNLYLYDLSTENMTHFYLFK